jgi:hypothetical protein
MSLVPWLTIATSNDRNNSTKTLNAIMSITYIAILALAAFLAILDMGSLEGTAPKVWLFLLAVFAPELYVILHGLSSSSLGLPFFSRTLLEVPGSAHMPSSVSSASPASALASEIRKAATRLKCGAKETARAAISSAGSTLDSISTG